MIWLPYYMMLFAIHTLFKFAAYISLRSFNLVSAKHLITKNTHRANVCGV